MIMFADYTNTCSSDYPFAYSNGAYCCRSNGERTDQYGYPDGSPSEIESGTCDGIGFTRESHCCENNDWQECPYSLTGCDDFQDGKEISDNLYGPSFIIK